MFFSVSGTAEQFRIFTSIRSIFFTFLYDGSEQHQVVDTVRNFLVPFLRAKDSIFSKTHIVERNDVLCQHSGQRSLRGAALQGRRSLKGREAVRIIAGVLLGLAGQQHPASVYLLFKYLFEFVLCDRWSPSFLEFGYEKAPPFRVTLFPNYEFSTLWIKVNVAVTTVTT